MVISSPCLSLFILNLSKSLPISSLVFSSHWLSLLCGYLFYSSIFQNIFSSLPIFAYLFAFLHLIFILTSRFLTPCPSFSFLTLLHSLYSSCFFLFHRSQLAKDFISVLCWSVRRFVPRSFWPSTHPSVRPAASLIACPLITWH